VRGGGGVGVRRAEGKEGKGACKTPRAASSLSRTIEKVLHAHAGVPPQVGVQQRVAAGGAAGQAPYLAEGGAVQALFNGRRLPVRHGAQPQRRLPLIGQLVRLHGLNGVLRQRRLAEGHSPARAQGVNGTLTQHGQRAAAPASSRPRRGGRLRRRQARACLRRREGKRSERGGKER
jgi:hypothetical protein